eukprot:scaffold7084_cov100-Cylindrotheca_fusiformis.AAC.3
MGFVASLERKCDCLVSQRKQDGGINVIVEVATVNHLWGRARRCKSSSVMKKPLEEVIGICSRVSLVNNYRATIA